MYDVFIFPSWLSLIVFNQALQLDKKGPPANDSVDILITDPPYHVFFELDLLLFNLK